VSDFLSKRQKVRPVQIILIILGIWLLLSVLGFVVKALFWLGIIAAIAFVVTLAVGAAKRKQIGQ